MFKAIDKWLLPYLTRVRRTDATLPRHLVISICDHYEPFHHADKPTALKRVSAWHDGMRRMADLFSDSDGHPPKHSYFFPIEQYDEDVVAAIGRICADTGSEGGIHLHHDGDDAESLESQLITGRDRLRDHGLLGPDRRYPFIHGNWALDNSHPDGRHCGVTGELAVLRKTGCYGDFTMPSAPSPTQTRKINSIYYAASTMSPKSHDTGTDAGPATTALRDDPRMLLMVQGPLGLNWGWRKLGVLPRLENGDLTGNNPPTLNRLDVWRSLAPSIAPRDDVAFVKLHTHGAIERNSSMLLGEPMQSFHRTLSESGLSYHYATAREMVNIIHALEDGMNGEPGEYRDYLFRGPES